MKHFRLPPSAFRLLAAALRLFLVACSLQLAACGSLPAAPAGGERVTLTWIQLDETALQATCRARTLRTARPSAGRPQRARIDEPATTVNGCYDHIDGACVIYTRRADDNTLRNERFQQTVGHEVLHCFRGFYHP